jgi:hypothetical protein
MGPKMVTIGTNNLLLKAVTTFGSITASKWIVHFDHASCLSNLYFPNKWSFCKPFERVSATLSLWYYEMIYYTIRYDIYNYNWFDNR